MLENLRFFSHRVLEGVSHVVGLDFDQYPLKLGPGWLGRGQGGIFEKRDWDYVSFFSFFVAGSDIFSSQQGTFPLLPFNTGECFSSFGKNSSQRLCGILLNFRTSVNLNQSVLCTVGALFTVTLSYLVKATRVHLAAGTATSLGD